MKRKKSFLLVEVIIGLALFSLCALPLLRQPFSLTQNSYNYLFEAELARHAENTHCALLADLQMEEIRWTSLPKTPKSSYPLPSTLCQIDLDGGIKRTFAQTTTINFKSIKKITDQQNALLCEIAIVYVPQSAKTLSGKTYKFTYLLTAIGPATT